jgi:hypothetical protein
MPAAAAAKAESSSKRALAKKYPPDVVTRTTGRPWQTGLVLVGVWPFSQQQWK